MASFFRPYFSLKLAASRTSAKWAADPGCEEAEPDDYSEKHSPTLPGSPVNHTNLFRLVVLDCLFENVNGAVDVLLVGVHRHQS